MKRWDTASVQRMCLFDNPHTNVQKLTFKQKKTNTSVVNFFLLTLQFRDIDSFD